MKARVLLRPEWSPEQVAGYLHRHGQLAISHETIYRPVWRDLRGGGSLHLHLRCAPQQCRKRNDRQESRGRLAGERMIGERPSVVERRRQLSHWEIDPVIGRALAKASECTWPLVERKSGYVLVGTQVR